MPTTTYVMPVAREPFAKPEKVLDSERKKLGETTCQELRNLSQAPTISAHNVDGRPTTRKAEGLFSPVLSDRSQLVWSIFLEIRSEQEEKELGSLVYMRYSTRDTLGNCR